MPLPTPLPKENKPDFMERCLADETMLKEYPSGVQRYAVCLTQYKLAKEPKNQSKTDSIQK